MTIEQHGRVRVERSAKRLRGYLGDELVFDTTAPLLVWERPYYPTYYVPAVDVVAELVDTGEVHHSPSRGDAAVLSVRAGSHDAPGAARRHDDGPLDDLRGHVRFEWGALDSWYEEDEEVFTHARSPYTRVDILPTSRTVVVRRRLAGGQGVAGVVALDVEADVQEVHVHHLALSRISAAAAAVASIWRSDKSVELKAAALGAGAALATPYLYTYDLVVLAVPLAFLYRLGRRDGFLTYEAGSVMLACALIASFPFVAAPVGFAAVCVIAAVVLRRAWIAR